MRLSLDVVSHILQYVGKELYHNKYTGFTHIRFSKYNELYATLQTIYEKCFIYSTNVGHSAFCIAGAQSMTHINCTTFGTDTVHLWITVNHSLRYHGRFGSIHVIDFKPYQIYDRDHKQKTIPKLIAFGRRFWPDLDWTEFAKITLQ